MRHRTLALAFFLGLLAGTASASGDIMPNFVDLPVKTASGAAPSMAEIRDAIVYAGSAAVRRWAVSDAGPGKLIARLEVPRRRRTHVVVVEIVYGPTRYSVNYLDSSHMNFNAAERTIHSSYGVWIGELVTNIDRGLSKGVPGAAPAPASAPAEAGVPAAEPTPGPPQVGDMWSYRATRIWGRGEIHSAPTVRTYVVRVASSSASEVVDQLTIDGGAPVATKHGRGAYLVTQGYSIFSPYLAIFADLSRPGSLGSAENLDSGCKTTHVCSASARVVGTESIQVAAGTFMTTRIVVEESWRAQAISSGASTSMAGGRTLTVWYSPQLKRAVKYSSRVTVGDTPPVEPRFDMELVSYQIK